MYLHDIIARMPKVDLHVHLEGTIQPKTILELAKRNHITLPATSEKELHDFFRFRDFDHFVATFLLISSCLKTPEDYELIAYEFGKDCQRQNIRYAEVTFSIETNGNLTGLPWQTILDALNRGRAQAQKDFGIEWQWVFDIIRDHPDSQHPILAFVEKAQKNGDGIIALGLTGHENAAPANRFEATFREAQKNNIWRTIHAGELAGPSSIIEAIDILHANRIGHGVRAIEDPELVRELAKREIPLEICPTSNVCLGVYPSYEQHPLRKLWDAGIFITINDDDPALFNTDMNNEYRILVEHFGFTAPMLQQVSLNGIKASFLPEDQKKNLTETFHAEFERL